MTDLFGTFASATAITATFGVWALGVASVRLWDRTELSRAMIGHRLRSRRCARSVSAVAHGRESAAPDRGWAVDVPPLPEKSPPRVLPAPARVPVADHGQGAQESAVAARSLPPPLPANAGVSSPVARVQAAAPPLSTAEINPVRVQMRAIDHISEFLAVVRAEKLGRNPVSGRWEAVSNDRAWVSAYHAWAAARAIQVLPADVFLNLLGKAPGVIKSRDRIKDGDGRVLKNANGTPLRAVHYTVTELPAETKRAPERPQRRAAAGSGGKPQTMDAATRERLLQELEYEPPACRAA